MKINQVNLLDEVTSCRAEIGNLLKPLVLKEFIENNEFDILNESLNTKSLKFLLNEETLDADTKNINDVAQKFQNIRKILNNIKESLPQTFDVQKKELDKYITEIPQATPFINVALSGDTNEIMKVLQQYMRAESQALQLATSMSSGFKFSVALAKSIDMKDNEKFATKLSGDDADKFKKKLKTTLKVPQQLLNALTKQSNGIFQSLKSLFVTKTNAPTKAAGGNKITNIAKKAGTWIKSLFQDSGTDYILNVDQFYESLSLTPISDIEKTSNEIQRLTGDIANKIESQIPSAPNNSDTDKTEESESGKLSGSQKTLTQLLKDINIDDKKINDIVTRINSKEGVDRISYIENILKNSKIDPKIRDAIKTWSNSKREEINPHLEKINASLKAENTKKKEKLLIENFDLERWSVLAGIKKE